MFKVFFFVVVALILAASAKVEILEEAEDHDCPECAPPHRQEKVRKKKRNNLQKSGEISRVTP
jgi:hypothetical protein